MSTSRRRGPAGPPGALPRPARKAGLSVRGLELPGGSSAGAPGPVPGSGPAWPVPAPCAPGRPSVPPRSARPHPGTCSRAPAPPSRTPARGRRAGEARARARALGLSGGPKPTARARPEPPAGRPRPGAGPGGRAGAALTRRLRWPRAGCKVGGAQSPLAFSPGATPGAGYQQSLPCLGCLRQSGANQRPGLWGLPCLGFLRATDLGRGISCGPARCTESEKARGWGEVGCVTHPREA